MIQNHPFGPLYGENSRVLILGSFPSVKSRENEFYYGHPRNRFWKVLSHLLNVPVPETVEEKTQLLLEHNIALWDVVQSCDIHGSSDGSIRNVAPADLSIILNAAPIQNIYANGTKAGQLYQKYQYPLINREIIPLPSTSPANAAWNWERLMDAWSAIIK